MTDEIILVKPSSENENEIRDYRDAFLMEDKKYSYIADRIPGLNLLEEFDEISDWISFCDSVSDKISWYMGVRKADGKVIGFSCFRHRLKYDDDDPEFASHIGYSVRPDERGKGYAKAILRLTLQKAAELGKKKVRLICIDTNTASSQVIKACGGILIDSVYGGESGVTVNRYDIPLKEDTPH